MAAAETMGPPPPAPTAPEVAPVPPVKKSPASDDTAPKARVEAGAAEPAPPKAESARTHVAKPHYRKKRLRRHRRARRHVHAARHRHVAARSAHHHRKGWHKRRRCRGSTATIGTADPPTIATTVGTARCGAGRPASTSCAAATRCRGSRSATMAARGACARSIGPTAAGSATRTLSIRANVSIFLDGGAGPRPGAPLALGADRAPKMRRAPARRPVSHVFRSSRSHVFSPRDPGCPR